MMLRTDTRTNGIKSDSDTSPIVHTLIHTGGMVGDESRTKCYPGLLWLCLRYYNNSITYDMKGVEEAA